MMAVPVATDVVREVDGDFADVFVAARRVQISRGRSDVPCGQEDGNSRAVPFRRTNGYLSAVELYQLGDDGEAEPATPAAARARRVDTIVRLENPEQIFARNTDAGILHEQLHKTRKKPLP